jgi:NTE family protein
MTPDIGLIGMCRFPGRTERRFRCVEWPQTARPVIAEGSAPTFVLSGGGNLGALQVGMLHALVESGVQPEMIVGTSVGAINGAFLASHPGISGILEIISFWSSLRRRDVLGIRASALIGGLLSHRGYLFDSNPMRRVLESFVSFGRLEDAPVRLAVVATDLATSAPAVLETGDVMTALLASCAIPRILPPVEIDRQVLADGAASADVPLREAILLGARNLYVLPTAPLQVERLRGRVDVWSAGAERDVSVRIVTPPRVHVPLGDLRQSPRLIELGYRHAKSWVLEGSPSESVATASDTGSTH